MRLAGFFLQSMDHLIPGNQDSEPGQDPLGGTDFRDDDAVEIEEQEEPGSPDCDMIAVKEEAVGQDHDDDYSSGHEIETV